MGLLEIQQIYRERDGELLHTDPPVILYTGQPVTSFGKIPLSILPNSVSLDTSYGPMETAPLSKTENGVMVLINTRIVAQGATVQLEQRFEHPEYNECTRTVTIKAREWWDLVKGGVVIGKQLKDGKVIEQVLKIRRDTKASSSTSSVPIIPVLT